MTVLFYSWGTLETLNPFKDKIYNWGQKSTSATRFQVTYDRARVTDAEKASPHFTGWLYFCELTIKWIYLQEFYILTHYSDRTRYLCPQNSRHDLNRNPLMEGEGTMLARCVMHGYSFPPIGHFLKAELCSTFSTL